MTTCASDEALHSEPNAIIRRMPRLAGANADREAGPRDVVPGYSLIDTIGLAGCRRRPWRLNALSHPGLAGCYLCLVRPAWHSKQAEGMVCLHCGNEASSWTKEPVGPCFALT